MTQTQTSNYFTIAAKRQRLQEQQRQIQEKLLLIENEFNINNLPQPEPQLGLREHQKESLKFLKQKANDAPRGTPQGMVIECATSGGKTIMAMLAMMEFQAV